ncbi:ATP-binding protein [Kocuria atrinae]|uniref:ATP-binding protein n=1 Tax=Kocuria atrinae TaxID=592377 RepID=UPI001CB934F9|nr:ATP-binding protein [Kocuria atrinae]
MAAALDTVDHQVVFGRRGTGKTHALRYLESEVRERGDLAVYVDLRTVGSPQGLFVGEELSDAERAARLLVDTLSFVHDELLSNVIEDEYLMSDSNLINRLDQFADSISSLRVDGSVEISDSTSNRNSNTNGFGLSGTLSVAPSAQISGKTESTVEKSDEHKEVHIGAVRTSLNFRQISLSLRNLNSALYGKRLWLLLDEWISVPARLQPMLGEFLVRCVTPNPEFTVKIGAIEQQSNFRESVEGGIIGIELGRIFLQLLTLMNSWCSSRIPSAPFNFSRACCISI